MPLNLYAGMLADTFWGALQRGSKLAGGSHNVQKQHLRYGAEGRSDHELVEVLTRCSQPRLQQGRSQSVELQQRSAWQASQQSHILDR